MTTDAPRDLLGDEAVAVASSVLARHFNAPVALREPVVLKSWNRNVVARCAVRPARLGVGSVVVKQITSQPARGYTDWASLSFLTALNLEGVAPRFYGGDSADGLFVMEDLGGSGSVEDAMLARNDAGPATPFVHSPPAAHTPAMPHELALSAANASAAPAAEPAPERRRAQPDDAVLPARDALVRLADVTARLHSATAAAEAGEGRFDRVRHALPHAEPGGRRREADAWLAAAVPAIEGWLWAAGCRVPTGLDPTLQHVSRAFANPGPWLAFTHGDPAPTNNHVVGGRVTLLDFEYGGFRHALYDMTGWDTLCPLPGPVVGSMRSAYRAAVAREGGTIELANATTDDGTFDDAWATMSAYRAVAILGWLGPGVLRENRPWVGAWSARAALLAVTERLPLLLERAGALAPLHEAALTLGRALRQKWPEFDDKMVTPGWPGLE